MTSNFISNLPYSKYVTERRLFTHDGYTCAVQMGPYSINGYIDLPEDHPWLEGEPEFNPNIDVHGGITYHKGTTIGFDTNHNGDGQHPDALFRNGFAPGVSFGHVWDWEEVECELKKLAVQAAEVNRDPWAGQAQ